MTEDAFSHGDWRAHFFNDEYVIEEIKKKNWNFPKLNLNKTQIQPNLWDTIKWVLRGKLITIYV